MDEKTINTEVAYYYIPCEKLFITDRREALETAREFACWEGEDIAVHETNSEDQTVNVLWINYQMDVDDFMGKVTPITWRDKIGSRVYWWGTEVWSLGWRFHRSRVSSTHWRSRVAWLFFHVGREIEGFGLWIGKMTWKQLLNESEG
jgi:hypothetical protein